MNECGMCEFKSINRLTVVQHTIRHHKNHPNFVATCNYPGCEAFYYSWASFKSHIARKHRNAVFPDPEPEEQIQENAENEVIPEDDNYLDFQIEVNEPAENLVAENGFDIQGRYVKFVQRLREGCNVSQMATDVVTNAMKQFYDEFSTGLKVKLLQSANPDGFISAASVEKVCEDLNFLEAIQNVKSKYLLDKYLVDSGFLIMPEKVFLDHEWVWIHKPTVHMTRKDIYFQEVPFLPQLKQLLNQTDVLYCVDHPRPSLVNGLLRDYRDGEYMKNHRIFGNNPSALQIILYYDDVEIVNPLGSKTKTHKLAMFYWTLGNIYPAYRSALKVVNLLCIVRSVLLRKYGVDKVLANFVRDLKELESEEGITFDIKGVNRKFSGSLLMFAGDTLAANYVGGFKEGVAFANKPCRACLGTRETTKELFKETSFELRTKQGHLEQCADINYPGIPKDVRIFWSKEHGITAKSILCELETFDITKCLVQDLMHVVIEGVLELEVRHLLIYCRENNYLRLKKLNSTISTFDYGHLSKDRPSQIDSSHLDHKLRQNCAQLITLGNSLPFLLEDCLDSEDEHLKNLVLLLQILNMMLAYSITTNEVALMKTMIEIHHTQFVQLYRAPTPKFHFMIHIPNQILRFGPCRHLWCMRFEAAHCRFKHLASVVKNFRNISFTLAYRHQSLRCAEIFSLPNEPDKNILCKEDSVTRGHTLKLVLYEHANHVNNCVANCNLEQEVVLTNKVHVRGTSYLLGGIVLLEDNEHELPQFGLIVKIVVYNTEKILVYKKLISYEYVETLNAYEVRGIIPDFGAICVTSLIHPHPLSVFRNRGSSFVILLNHKRCEFF